MNHFSFFTFRQILVLLGCWMLIPKPTATAQAKPDSLKTARVSGFVGYILDGFTCKYAVAAGGAITTSAACGAFENGNDTSLEIGVGYARDFSSRLGLRGLLTFRNGAFQQSFNCTDPAQILTPTGTTQALTRFVNRVNVSTISLSLLGDFQPFAIPLRISAGPAVSITIQEDYSADEEVVTPITAEFLEGGQTRNIGAGSGNGDHISVAADAEAAYPIIAGESLRLLPSVAVRHFFSSPISWASFGWNSVTLRLGLEYQFWSTPAEPSTIAQAPSSQPDTVEYLASPPAMEVPTETPARFAIGWSNTANGDTAIAQQRQLIRQQSIPLLPYIFFDSGSTQIPERYRLQSHVGAAERENAASEIATAAWLHRSVLDTIGQRLRLTPAARITITGTAPERTGADAISTAAARAAAVQNYLAEVWSIDRTRIAIAGVAAPESPTISSSPQGFAENIRAEIASDNPAILSPIIFRDTVSTISNPTISGRVIPGSDSLISVEIERENGARQRLALHDRVEKNGVERSILVEGVVRPLPRLAGTEGSVETLRLKIITRGRKPSETPLYLRTEAEKEVRLEALALFPFGSARLAEKDAEAIRQLRRWAGPNATALLLGSTDDLGEAAGNLQLSRGRAATAAALLGLPVARTEGVGEIANTATLRYPEERMYARSVRVRIERGSEE